MYLTERNSEGKPTELPTKSSHKISPKSYDICKPGLPNWIQVHRKGTITASLLPQYNQTKAWKATDRLDTREKSQTRKKEEKEIRDLFTKRVLSFKMGKTKGDIDSLKRLYGMCLPTESQTLKYKSVVADSQQLRRQYRHKVVKTEAALMDIVYGLPDLNLYFPRKAHDDTKHMERWLREKKLTEARSLTAKIVTRDNVETFRNKANARVQRRETMRLGNLVSHMDEATKFCRSEEKKLKGFFYKHTGLKLTEFFDMMGEKIAENNELKERLPNQTQSKFRQASLGDIKTFLEIQGKVDEKLARDVRASLSNRRTLLRPSLASSIEESTST